MGPTFPNLKRHTSFFSQSRETSPHSHNKPDTISSLKQIEEETQPKYNPDAFYPTKIGELLNNRYKVIAKLGYGMTATVWLAKDTHNSPGKNGSGKAGRNYVTLKININTLTENWLKGRSEIASCLATKNPSHPGYEHVRFMLETFMLKSHHGQHKVIVYDVLREPIGVCMEKLPTGLFGSNNLRLLLPALLNGLDYMHSECRIVHTDLKPDNIMMGLGDPTVLEKFIQDELEHPSPRKTADHKGRIIYQSRSDFGGAPTEDVIASAKITDIGLAVWGDEKQNKSIQSNAFTAPEVILTAGWSYPADIWNLGVMLWDLIEDFGLFDRIDTRPGKYHSDKHLGYMIALMGPPPKALLERGSTSATYFDSNGNFRYPELVPDDFSFETSVTRFTGDCKEYFIDFAKKMVAWMPEDRWTAKQLLEHPFLQARTGKGSPLISPQFDAQAEGKAVCEVSISPISPISKKGEEIPEKGEGDIHKSASSQDLIDAILKR